MDVTLVDIYKQMVRLHKCSVDDILVDPNLRQEFLSNSRSRLGSDMAEETLLRRLSNLRKRSKLPRASDLIAEHRREVRA
jgi:hypothetical protein